MDQKLVLKRVLEVSDRLLVVERQIAVAGDVRGNDAREADAVAMATLRLAQARDCLDGLLGDLVADEPTPPAMRACPHCASPIRAQATVCGYCWQRP